MSEHINQTINNPYNSRVNSVLLNMARYIPIVMLSYGLLVHFKITPGSDLYSWQALVLLVLILTVVGITQDDGYDQSKLQQFAYYLIFLSFSVFVIGMDSIIVYWPPLAIATVLNFGVRSYWWSCLLLFAFALLDSLIHWGVGGLNYLVNDLVRVLLVTVASYIVVAIVAGLMTDHTNLAKTKKKESMQYHRMQALINGLNDAIFSVNNNGVIKLYNAAALNLLDTNKSLVNHKIDDVFTIRNKEGKHTSLFKEVDRQKKMIVRDDLSHRFADGERILLGVTAAPIYTPFGEQHHAHEGYIFIVRDITKSKSLEEERDEFISVISHELRTPITITEASISNMQIVAKRENATDTIQKGLDAAHNQVLYLASMINDLSALSRAERDGGIETTQIDVQSLMTNIFNEYTPQARSAQLFLDIDVAPSVGSVVSHRLYLEEILQNFVTNAIKYTGQGTVTIHASRLDDNSVLFAVKDTGPGIAKTERDKVFDKFYRSEDYRTRETSGTGLGLYVAQKLAHKIGTNIELKSRLNHGSTFSFILRDK